VKRVLRWLGYVLGGVLLFGLLGVASALMWLRPEHVAELLSMAVRQQTGRELLVSGPTAMRIGADLEVQMHQVRLGGPPDAESAAHFASSERLDLRIRLLPLLLGRIEIDSLEVKGLRLELRRDAAGRGNWEGLSVGKPLPSPPQVEGNDRSLWRLEILRLHIRDARIHWQGQELRFDDLELEYLRDLLRLTAH
jgi:uncharacterized protein involved in outer membrane biogenesis